MSLSLQIEKVREQVDQIKDQVLQVGGKMAAAGLVIGTWGNISARVPGEELFIITPSGMPYDALAKTDLAVIDASGTVVEGSRKPSSELLMHLAIYAARRDVMAIVHTHSVFASALAVAGKSLPPILEELAQLVGGEVPVTRYARAGTSDLGQAVVEVLSQSNAVLLANHGMAGMGRTVAEALQVCLVVEKAAQVFAWASLMGRAVAIPDEEVGALRESFLTAYGQGQKDRVIARASW